MALTKKQIESEDLKALLDRCHNEFELLSEQNLLLTGCAGFLGYYLSKAIKLWNDNYEHKIRATLQDNFSRGRPEWLDLLAGSDGISVQKHDVMNEIENFRFHNVIHAASIASPIFYRKNPIQTMDANVVGLRNLLNQQEAFAKGSGEKTNFLYFSTSEIYGDPDQANIPTSETYRGNVSCTGPRACYDESKRFGETLCVNFTKQFGLRTVIVRPFNNYGPGLKIDDGRVIPDFCGSLLNHGKIALLSDGSPTRTFCYVSDAIAGYIKALVKGRDGESYNIGSESPEISMRSLANEFATAFSEITGKNANINFSKSVDEEYLTDNPNRRCPDISKARREIGFSPEVSLADGVRKTLVWYKG